MHDLHGVLYGSDRENASLKLLPIGNIIRPESQLLHFDPPLCLQQNHFSWALRRY